MHRQFESINILRLHRYFCAPDWTWAPRGRSAWRNEDSPTVSWNFDLWTVMQGRGFLETPESRYELQAGDSFILRGDNAYQAGHDPADPLVVLAVHFDFIGADGLPVFPGGLPFHRRFQPMDFYVHLLDRTEAAWLAGQRARSAFWLQACLHEFEGVPGCRPRGFRRQQADAIEAIAAEIRRHPERHQPVDRLAARLHCTRQEFTRRFKEVMKATPRDFMISARIEAAKGMLHASTYPVSRIAESLGYTDVYFFSRQFKARTGLSPSQYREGR